MSVCVIEPPGEMCGTHAHAHILMLTHMKVFQCVTVADGEVDHSDLIRFKRFFIFNFTTMNCFMLHIFLIYCVLF